MKVSWKNIVLKTAMIPYCEVKRWLMTVLMTRVTVAFMHLLMGEESGFVIARWKVMAWHVNMHTVQLHCFLYCM